MVSYTITEIYPLRCVFVYNFVLSNVNTNDTATMDLSYCKKKERKKKIQQPSLP